ncbi:YncE family protein [Amycolatopsis sp. NPDC004079]|uniref:YncE family protein n=1 Tax=Amycolatopsis sp. NPDC004079 TaxID=3154549 RepID=UPI0033A45DE5
MREAILAVAGAKGPAVAFFDVGSGKHLGTVEVPAQPHDLCFDPVHRLVWCASAYRAGAYHRHGERATELTAIDPDSREIVEVVDLSPDHAPHGLAIDPMRGLLYATVEAGPGSEGGLVVVDTATRRPVRHLATGAPGPHWVAISPDGRRGFVTNKEAPFVSFVDLDSGEVERVSVPGSEGLEVSRDGKRLYVATPYLDNGTEPVRATPGVRVFDAVAGSLETILQTERPVLPIQCTTAGEVLAAEMGGRLLAFSAASNELLGSMELRTEFPLAILSDPEGRIAFVSGAASTAVEVIDLETRTLVTTLDTEAAGAPGGHGLAYVPVG